MPLKKCFSEYSNEGVEIQQLNTGQDPLCTWQSQYITSNWKFGYLPSETTLLDLDHFNKMSSGAGDGNDFNSQNYWDSKEGMQTHLDVASGMLPPQFRQTSLLNCNNYNNAYLVLVVPPEIRFRYRYDTEMSGTHGSLQGIGTGREKKVPTVELVNFPHEALIRVSLVTCQEDNEYYPHPHSLFVKEKLYQKKVYVNWNNKSLTKTGHYSDPHYIEVGKMKNDYTARFEGMCIINSKKENFHSSVKEKLQMRFFEQKYGVYKDPVLKHGLIRDNEELARKVEEAVSAVDVNNVSLCFEAFREQDGKLFPICPPIYSKPIGNGKSAQTGKLKISRINKCSGSCAGGDEIWLLVEKINKKGLVVRFSEECNNKIIWQSCLEGDQLTLHHQYAIIFNTPPYRDTNILTEVEVLMRLERVTQPNQPSDYSEPITFVYEPSKCKINKGDNLSRKESILTPLNKQIHIKRPRTDYSSPVCNFLSKRKTDNLDIETKGDVLENFENSYDDMIDQMLRDGTKGFDFDSAFLKNEVEDLLQYITSDDVNMPLQKDGVPSTKLRRDFLCKFILISKLDGGEFKKLTDRYNISRASRKESESKRGNDKDQVKDAASTLLSLRSSALAKSNSTSEDNEKGNDSTNPNIAEPIRIPESCGENSNTKLNEPNLNHVTVIKKFSKAKISHENEIPMEDKTKRDTSSIGATRGEKLLAECLKNHPAAMDPDIAVPIGINLIKDIKKETEVPMSHIDDIQINKICNILNKNGSWVNLAEMWDCSHAISAAEKSINPAKHILDCVEEAHGSLELESLRNILDAIQEKKALELLDEMLAKKFY